MGSCLKFETLRAARDNAPIELKGLGGEALRGPQRARLGRSGCAARPTSGRIVSPRSNPHRQRRGIVRRVHVTGDARLDEITNAGHVRRNRRNAAPCGLRDRAVRVIGTGGGEDENVHRGVEVLEPCLDVPREGEAPRDAEPAGALLESLNVHTPGVAASAWINRS